MAVSWKPGDRPRTIVWFETLCILEFVADLIFGSGLTWDALVWVPILWVVLSISRDASNIARWIFTGLYAFIFSVVAYGLVTGMVGLADATSIAWVSTIASLLQLWLLWSPETSHWIASKRSSGASVAI
jgi:hypothetical protein